METQRRLANANGTPLLAAMTNTTVQVADLPSGLLGETTGKTRFSDNHAAGYGGYLDPTAADQSRFVKAIASGSLAVQKGTPAAARVDLLTAVMDEMGHVPGYDDTLSDRLMDGILPSGLRRTAAVEQAFASLYRT